MRIEFRKTIIAIISILLIFAFSACSKNAKLNDTVNTDNQIETTTAKSVTSMDEDKLVTTGTSEYKDFILDNILHSKEYGDAEGNLFSQDKEIMMWLFNK